MKIKTIKGKLLSSPICEMSPTPGTGIFFTRILAPYTIRPMRPNWSVTSRNVIHLALVLSNFRVKLSRILETTNENRKQYIAAHATPKILLITWDKEKRRVNIGKRWRPKHPRNSVGLECRSYEPEVTGSSPVGDN